MLHDIDQPPTSGIGNTLTGNEEYGGLFLNAPPLFDVVLMNPPFGGKEGKDAQTQFAYKTGGHTGSLFTTHHRQPHTRRPLRHCAGRRHFISHKRKSLCTDQTQTCRRVQPVVHCEPAPWCLHIGWRWRGKTNLLFFLKGEPTTEIWVLRSVKCTK